MLASKYDQRPARRTDRVQGRREATAARWRLGGFGALVVAVAGLMGGVTQGAEVGGRALVPGDCVMFREGGEGRLFKAPTYWLRGTVREVAIEPHWAGRCPDMGKPRSAFTPDDWARFVAASPCVEGEEEARAVERTRVRVAVDAWETPWSYSHGSAGWLFRGRFLGPYG